MTNVECRLLIDPPGDGAWNMAVDEMLLEWAAAHKDELVRNWNLARKGLPHEPIAATLTNEEEN